MRDNFSFKLKRYAVGKKKRRKGGTKGKREEERVVPENEKH